MDIKVLLARLHKMEQCIQKNWTPLVCTKTGGTVTLQSVNIFFSGGLLYSSEASNMGCKKTLFMSKLMQFKDSKLCIHSLSMWPSCNLPCIHYEMRTLCTSVTFIMILIQCVCVYALQMQDIKIVVPLPIYKIMWRVQYLVYCVTEGKCM
jgi:hypothetical protein